jgi:hypothetical protein
MRGIDKRKLGKELATCSTKPISFHKTVTCRREPKSGQALKAAISSTTSVVLMGVEVFQQQESNLPSTREFMHKKIALKPLAVDGQQITGVPSISN